MKYKLIKTDLMLAGSLIPENSIVEMTVEEAEEYSDFLKPVTVKDNGVKSKPGKRKNSK